MGRVPGHVEVDAMRSNPQLPLFVTVAAAAILTVRPVVAAPSLSHRRGSSRVQPVHPVLTPASMQLRTKVFKKK